jgi:hypothetical protein
MAVLFVGAYAWVGQLLVSVALSLASNAYTKHRQKGSNRKLPDGQKIKANTQATNEDMRVIYGKFRTGANRVYVATSGSFNFNIALIHSLAVGENEGIVNDESGNPYIWFGGERIFDKYAGNNLWGVPLYQFEEKTGSATQAAQSLISEHDDTLHYTHYIAWKLGFDQDKYQGIPNIQYLIAGRKLFDFRDSTTAWSDNPVLALYDYYTNNQYGMGRPSSIIDLDSWEEAADYCDTKNFKINAVYFSKDDVWANIREILSLFRGEFNDWDGKIYLRFLDLNEEASVLTIEDKHINQTEDGKAVLSVSEPGAYDAPTGMQVTFITAANNDYVEDSFIIGEQSDLLKEINVAGCTDREMAGILATYQFERMKLSRTISGVFRDDCLLLEPNDIVTFNSSALNISDQAMRILTAAYIGSGLISMTLQYESLALYNDVYDINTESVYSTNLPDRNSPSVIENAAISEVTYVERLRTRSKFEITFTIPESSWFQEVEVFVSTDGDVEANYTHQFNARESFFMDPVEEGQTYFIVLRTVNTWGVKQPFNQASKVSSEVTGQSDIVPGSIAYLHAVAGDGTLSLTSTKLNSSDIEIYEFRLGEQWSGGILLSQERGANVDLGAVKPGQHIFWCNTRGTNGLYGSTPRDATAVVDVPKGWSNYTTFDDDFLSSTSGQTFTNVEHITYFTEDYLKCSHAGDVLSGQYISEEFDTGVIAANYFMFIDTEIITVGAGTAWSDVLLSVTNEFTTDFTTDTATVVGHPYVSDKTYYVSSTTTLPDPLEAETEYYLVSITTDTFKFSLTEGGAAITLTDNGTGTHSISQVSTWADINLDSRSWKEIFEIDESPAVTMRIWYKEQPGDDWSYVENAQILAAVVSSRYHKVEINIEDPAVNVNAYVRAYTLTLYN